MCSKQRRNDLLDFTFPTEIDRHAITWIIHLWGEWSNFHHDLENNGDLSGEILIISQDFKTLNQCFPFFINKAWTFITLHHTVFELSHRTSLSSLQWSTSLRLQLHSPLFERAPKPWKPSTTSIGRIVSVRVAYCISLLLFF